MERNAHYAMVGLISILLVIGLAAFAVWLANVEFARRFDEYDVVFRGPVRGLSKGGEVFFNGIRVGEVVDLRLDGSDSNRVKAHIRVGSDTPVRVGSEAGLEPQGVTGVNYIQISAGKADARLLKDVTSAGATPVIPARQSTLDSLLEGGGNVLTRSVEALDRVNLLLSERNIAEISGTLADLHAVSKEMKNQKQLLIDLDQTVRGVNQTSDRIGALADDSRALVNGDAKRTLANLADAAQELKTAASETRGMISKLEGPATDFTTTGLPQLNRTVSSLQSTADSLDRLVSDIERNPRGVLAKAPARTVEVKP